MKKITLLAIASMFSLSIFAQADSTAIRQIDEQVWYPFIQYFEAWDAEKFNAIHTPDMLRGGPWGLRTGEEYLSSNLKNWPERKAAGREHDIAFTFEYRVLGDGVAYEVGYYRVVSKRDGKERASYGQFHVVLRQVDGVWKIAQDWDADEINGRPVTEEDFMKNAEKGLYEN